jgi:hypothetical protein
MSQNSQRLSWTLAEVDDHLKGIMKNIYAFHYGGCSRCGRPGDSINRGQRGWLYPRGRRHALAGHLLTFL